MLKILSAFLFGFLSFLSPCVLPLIPSYLCYITGLSFDEITESENEEPRPKLEVSSQKGKFIQMSPFRRLPDKRQIRKLVFFHSLMFVIGFTIIFVILGATATTLGSFILKHRNIVQKTAGVLIFLFGLYFTGVIRPRQLEKEYRFTIKNKPAGLFGSILIGIAFGAGWSPCIGPFLGSVLTMAATTENLISGVILLGTYSLGLGLPFLLAGVLFSWFSTYSKKIYRYMPLVSKLSGILLMLIGISIFFDYFNKFSTMFEF